MRNHVPWCRRCPVTSIPPPDGDCRASPVSKATIRACMWEFSLSGDFAQWGAIIQSRYGAYDFALPASRSSCKTVCSCTRSSCLELTRHRPQPSLSSVHLSCHAIDSSHGGQEQLSVGCLNITSLPSFLVLHPSIQSGAAGTPFSDARTTSPWHCRDSHIEQVRRASHFKLVE